MTKLLSFIVVGMLLLSCNTETKKKSTEENLQTEETVNQEYSNYAVVWNFVTDDVELVKKNVNVFTEELLDLWDSNVIENVYYGANPDNNKMELFPSISFFIKASDKEKASAILDQLTIVKENIATYKLHQVGLLWLGLNPDIYYDRGLDSYVTIRNTEINRPVDDLTKLQSDYIIDLWNKGTIENIYFDVESDVNTNNQTDFVFFINANNKEEAEEVCKSLPFFKEGISSYKIIKAGVYWMGLKKSK